MASGQQLAQENVAKVQQWIAAREAIGDFLDYEYRGQISRGSLASELGFARSVINQNPTVKALVQEAESRWYGEKQEQDKKATKAAKDRSDRKSEATSAENARLLDELAKVKAENAFLKNELRRHAAMQEVLAQSGIAPR